MAVAAYYVITMCKMTTNATTPSHKGAAYIILPFLAALLHCQAFYYASNCILRTYSSASDVDGSTTPPTSDEFRHEAFLLDRAIFLAYMFDLLCCYLKVIPFSRKFVLE